MHRGLAARLLSLTEYIHKQLPLRDEELSCRHSAETLVGSDEEEGTHPAGSNKPKSGHWVSVLENTVSISQPSLKEGSLSKKQEKRGF